METIIHYISNIGSILTLIITVSTLVTISVPNLRNMLYKWMHPYEEDFKKIAEKINLSNQADVCGLRNDILNIYMSHKYDKCLSLKEKESLSEMYNIYTALGGNSFVHDIYEEMKCWDTSI